MCVPLLGGTGMWIMVKKANAEFAHCTEFRNYKSHSEKVMKRQNARGEAGREKRRTSNC